jgi:hypothetical protein
MIDIVRIDIDIVRIDIDIVLFLLLSDTLFPR